MRRGENNIGRPNVTRLSVVGCVSPPLFPGCYRGRCTPKKSRRQPRKSTTGTNRYILVSGAPSRSNDFGRRSHKSIYTVFAASKNGTVAIEMRLYFKRKTRPQHVCILLAGITLCKALTNNKLVSKSTSFPAFYRFAVECWEHRSFQLRNQIT